MPTRDLPTAEELGVDDVHDVLTGLLSLDGEIRRGEFRILCPNPEHDERHPSTDVNLETGWWHCFSCGVGGDIANLVRYVLGISYTTAVDLLQPGSPDAKIAVVQRRVTNLRRRESARNVARTPQDENLHHPSRYSDGPLSYMRKRKFKRITLERYGVRYVERTRILSPDSDGGFFTIRHSIAIPIRNDDGKLLAWCYRATAKSGGWQPRYLYTPDFDTAVNWFGCDHVQDGDAVVVCEGPIDAMWISQCGFHSLGVMGASAINRRKASYLERFSHVVIFADYDAAGVLLTRSLGGLLEGRVPVSVARYPSKAIRALKARGGKKLDPCDLCITDIQHAIERAISWPLWKLHTRMEHGQRTEE